mgnify:CR=1 FL=1
MPTRSVALITYHAAHNNGSFLQAYATQRKIQQLGYDCDIINFSTPRQQYLYDVYKKVSGPKDIAKNLYALFHHKLIQRRHNDFTNLMHSALQLTPKFYEDLSQMVILRHNTMYSSPAAIRSGTWTRGIIVTLTS